MSSTRQYLSLDKFVFFRFMTTQNPSALNPSNDDDDVLFVKVGYSIADLTKATLKSQQNVIELKNQWKTHEKERKEIDEHLRKIFTEEVLDKQEYERYCIEMKKIGYMDK